MIVYTQTSPDVPRLLDSLRQAEQEGTVEVAIDGTSGFSWPWAWYFRGTHSVRFPTYNSDSFASAPSEPVVVVHTNNRDSADEGLADLYGRAERIRHRWWFPEYIYRELTPSKFVGALFDRSSWRRAMDYWLYREGIRDRLGSEDAYLYFKSDVPLDYLASP